MVPYFSKVLLDDGFDQTQADKTLFVRLTGSSFIAVLVYADNIVITSSDDNVVSAFKDVLHRAFEVKDMGPLRFFLRLEIAR